MSKEKMWIGGRMSGKSFFDDELSPLEALEEIRNFFHPFENEETFEIIETTLKDYEKKTKLAKEYDDVNNVAKRLKALEIIKEKQVDVYAVIESKSLKEMNDRFWFPKEEYKLTQEEYDLLKEVLL